MPNSFPYVTVLFLSLLSLPVTDVLLVAGISCRKVFYCQYRKHAGDETCVSQEF
jgi:hypothetical protein